jgi:excisionase family DNA binding protein
MHLPVSPHRGKELYTSIGIPRTVSVREAATQVGLSEDTLRRMIHAGSLVAHRVGKKCFRIPVSELIRLSEGGAK